MEKFSVRKPFTVLVAVLIVIILGFVSVSNMTTDLLPSMSLPYMIVVTPYPGASPERVETAGHPEEMADLPEETDEEIPDDDMDVFDL